VICLLLSVRSLNYTAYPYFRYLMLFLDLYSTWCYVTLRPVHYFKVILGYVAYFILLYTLYFIRWAHMKLVSLSALRIGRFTPQDIFLVLIYLKDWIDTRAWRIMSMKNSNAIIANRARGLPACSAVPQPTEPPRAQAYRVLHDILRPILLRIFHSRKNSYFWSSIFTKTSFSFSD